jgi:hypothetical protein
MKPSGQRRDKMLDALRRISQLAALRPAVEEVFDDMLGAGARAQLARQVDISKPGVRQCKGDPSPARLFEAAGRVVDVVDPESGRPRDILLLLLSRWRYAAGAKARRLFASDLFDDALAHAVGSARNCEKAATNAIVYHLLVNYREIRRGYSIELQEYLDRLHGGTDSDETLFEVMDEAAARNPVAHETLRVYAHSFLTSFPEPKPMPASLRGFVADFLVDPRSPRQGKGRKAEFSGRDRHIVAAAEAACKAFLGLHKTRGQDRQYAENGSRPSADWLVLKVLQRFEKLGADLGSIENEDGVRQARDRSKSALASVGLK